MVGTDRFRCPRCAETKERTPEHFYFDRLGRVTGYCRPCQRAWWRDYYAARSAFQRRRTRIRSRDWHRRHRGTRSDLWRTT